MSKFSDEYWMQLAYEQAELAAKQGEIPVGAVIVSQNKLIGILCPARVQPKVYNFRFTPR